MALACLLHAFPEGHRLFGVIACKGHQEEADVIGFRFLLPAVCQAAASAPLPKGQSIVCVHSG